MFFLILLHGFQAQWEKLLPLVCYTMEFSIHAHGFCFLFRAFGILDLFFVTLFPPGADSVLPQLFFSEYDGPSGYIVGRLDGGVVRSS